MEDNNSSTEVDGFEETRLVQMMAIIKDNLV